MKKFFILIGAAILAGVIGIWICKRLNTVRQDAHEKTSTGGPEHIPWDSILDRLDRIVIPKVAFDDVPAEDAIDFARMRCRELDPEPDPIFKGICIHVNPPRRAEDNGSDNSQSGMIEKPPTITYSGENVPLAVLVAEIARQTNLDAYITSTCIVICPRGVPPFPNHEQEEGVVLKTLHKGSD